MSSLLATNILLIIIAVDLIGIYSRLEKIHKTIVTVALGKRPSVSDLN